VSRDKFTIYSIYISIYISLLYIVYNVFTLDALMGHLKIDYSHIMKYCCHFFVMPIGFLIAFVSGCHRISYKS